MTKYEVRPSDRRHQVRTFDDAMEAAKHWRALCERQVGSDLYINGDRTPATPSDQDAAPVFEALQQLNDALPKVVLFKHEDDCAGVPVGPVTVGPDPDLVVLPGVATTVGEPWVPPCLCKDAGGKPGEMCSACGGSIREPWITLPEAEDKARELGLEVRET